VQLTLYLVMAIQTRLGTFCKNWLKSKLLALGCLLFIRPLSH